ncbi:trypsin inhibitor ClTI-1-like [Brienomyrus brachyistius]|uniref:trypsin inhibitor ClTI-1-like n=1 Tax=Brienomyrus brachyistius TaxID=42636 RepID=UPI0020B2CD8D|nr:trypsin inhibitor ClTI-1-like [Brienomyrus brachyistius]
MANKWFLLFFFAICTADAFNWKPPCEKFTDLNNCPTREMPVCGADGKTYNNICDLCSYMARTQQKISVTKRGEC